MTPDDNPELTSYDAGKRHGVTQVLELPAMEDIALQVVLLRATVAALTSELQKRERTIRAYQAIIRG